MICSDCKREIKNMISWELGMGFYVCNDCWQKKLKEPDELEKATGL